MCVCVVCACVRVGRCGCGHPSCLSLPPSLSLSLQVVYELPATSQWIFECHWCPRNPSIISTASFDGHVTMYSLLGGGTTHHEEPVNQVKYYFMHGEIAARYFVYF